MEDLDRAMDSMDELSSSLKKIEHYNSLFYQTGRMIITVLAFVAIVLFVDMLVLQQNFHDVNYSLGTIKTSGYGIGGTFLSVFMLLIILGSVVVYVITVLLNRRAMKKESLEPEPFDRSKGRDGLVGAIANVDWGKTRTELKRARFSFVIYNLSLIGVYSFLLFFVLTFSTTFTVVLINYFFPYLLSFSYTLFMIVLFTFSLIVSILISVFILRKKLRTSFREFKNLDVILTQLRGFLDEFEKSGLQT